MTTITLNGITYDLDDLVGTSGYGYADSVTAGTGDAYPRIVAMMADLLADASRARITSSSTSKDAGLTGSQSWVLATDLSFAVGSYVTIASAADPTGVYYFGQVTNYVSGTKTLTVSVIVSAGATSSVTDWEVGVSGARGETGSGRERNRIINGSFAVAQRATLGSTDNSYGLDRWRLLLEAATAAAVAQDTADVPTRAKYAAKLVVGSANNNKFGLFQPIEGINVYDLRGQNVSVRVPIKATSGITDVRIGIVEWTGTEDSISSDPISSWGSAGTNPTLIANWAFANTPANVSPTTSWAEYVVENVSISSSAVNLGLLIWCDDKTTTTTTDILRIGGLVGLHKGAEAQQTELEDVTEELSRCKRYYQNVKGNTMIVAPGQAFATTDAIIVWPLQEPMRSGASLSLSSAAHFFLLKAAGGRKTARALPLRTLTKRQQSWQ